jgi:hypothetical protein
MSRLLSDLSGARESALMSLHEALSDTVKASHVARAEKSLANHGASPPARVLPFSDDDVYLVTPVFTPVQCSTILEQLRTLQWEDDRHLGKYKTTDLPLTAIAVPEIELMIRSTVFERLLRPLAEKFYGSSFLPEHLRYRDVFFVRYSTATPQSQTSLPVHTDGSSFSFNVLLSDPSSFGGGGTFFETCGRTVNPSQGCALAHSGKIRHAGATITSGERYLLVGFIGHEPNFYDSKMARWAAYSGFCKFGTAAFDKTLCEDSVITDAWKQEESEAAAEADSRLL